MKPDSQCRRRLERARSIVELSVLEKTTLDEHQVSATRPTDSERDFIRRSLTLAAGSGKGWNTTLLIRDVLATFAAAMLPRYEELDREVQEFERFVAKYAYPTRRGRGPRHAKSGKPASKVSLRATLGRYPDGSEATVDLDEIGHLMVIDGTAPQWSRAIATAVARQIAANNEPGSVQFACLGSLQAALSATKTPKPYPLCVPLAPHDNGSMIEAFTVWLWDELRHRQVTADDPEATEPPLIVLVGNDLHFDSSQSARRSYDRLFQVAEERAAVGIHLVVSARGALGALEGPQPRNITLARAVPHGGILDRAGSPKEPRHCFGGVLADYDRSWLLDGDELVGLICRGSSHGSHGLHQMDGIDALLAGSGTPFKLLVDRNGFLEQTPATEAGEQAPREDPLATEGGAGPRIKTPATNEGDQSHRKEATMETTQDTSFDKVRDALTLSSVRKILFEALIDAVPFGLVRSNDGVEATLLCPPSIRDTVLADLEDPKVLAKLAKALGVDAVTAEADEVDEECVVLTSVEAE